MKRGFVFVSILILLAGMCSGVAMKPAAADERVTLTIAGPWTDFLAIERVTERFTKENPQCRVVYEYVQNYYASLEKRLAQGAEGEVDLFVTVNIQPDTSAASMLPYALDLFSRPDLLDLSHTYEGLIRNFTFMDTDPNAPQRLYAVPLGSVLRGLYVNKTLLKRVGVNKVPENRAELLDACATLKANGYIPLQGNPGHFGQQFMYPYICNQIVHAADPQAAYDRVNNCEAGVSELFREPLQLLYDIVAAGYYEYKTVETELGLYKDAKDEAIIMDFLSIKDGVKIDDVGQTAFTNNAQSLLPLMDKFKSDYHSQIEYEFILAPVGEKNGFAYMSPAHAIGVNKESANLDWALRFLSFMYTEPVITDFAAAFGVIPNTTSAMDYIHKTFDIPEDSISELGQVTFSYGFYNLICESLVEISKANNPKYMLDDGAGGKKMVEFETFMNNLEERFAKQREGGSK